MNISKNRPLVTVPKITLAPMDGLVDHPMRELLTRIGGIDLCVTEFLRVTKELLPRRVFFRICPELYQGAHTQAGVPVRIQLLGSDPSAMGDNAARAVELGSPGIDLNFGCPAKTVNRSKGGAILLQDPEAVFSIVAAVRSAVPKDYPVTVKMRLGFTDKSLAVVNAMAIQEAGAAMLTVHARTKVEGYHPPAYWEFLRKITEATDIPVVANGEVWTLADYHRCRSESGCQSVMLGRGVITQPDLALQIQRTLAGSPYQLRQWDWIVGLLEEFYAAQKNETKPRYLAGRIKQWVSLLTRNFGEAQQLFSAIKRESCPAVIMQHVALSGSTACIAQ